MQRIVLTRELAWAVATDKGDRSMRKAGRKDWNDDDYAAAVEEFDRLWPIERDIQDCRVIESSITRE